MALRFGLAALVKSLVRTFMAPLARTRTFAPTKTRVRTAERTARERVVSLGVLSPEAEAALSPLDLPPDGPFDATAILRAKLAPKVAASNFVRWARALDLLGPYSRRSIYALYCEFSEVDQRPPLSDKPFFDALMKTEGVRRKEQRIDWGNGKFRRIWQWTVEPAAKLEVTDTIAAPGKLAEPASEVCLPDEARPTTTQEPPARLLAPTKPLRPGNLPRYVPDKEHPFSPAVLREQAKHARRAQLNAAVSRKQRGQFRRAA